MPQYRVRDQLHVSSLGPETMAKGTLFSVSKPIGDDLVKRELADLVAADPVEPAAAAEQPAAAKAEPRPKNKALAAAPANKGASKGKARAKKA